MYVLRIRPITASAQSSGVADRCSGDVAATESCWSCHPAVHGVATSPGATALTRTGAQALARSGVRWFNAAFAIAYAIDDPSGRSPAIEVIVTTLPSVARRSCAMA